MSKESAMAVATGQPAPTVQPPVAPIEGTNAAANPPQPATVTTDPRLQALLKKEVALVNERSAWNKQKQDLEQRAKSADEILGRAKQFEDLKAKDPVAALRLIGYSETEIFNIMAAAQEPAKTKTPEEIAQETTNKVLKERDAADAKRNAELVAKQNDEQVDSSISSVLKDPVNADKYEYCAYHGEIAQGIIKETLFLLAGQVQAEAQSKGEQFVIDEAKAQELLVAAVEAVEDYYFETDKAMQGKIKKRRAITGETTAEATAAVAAQEANTQAAATNPAPAVPTPQEKRTTTLSSRVSATSVAMAGQKESPAQKRARLEQILATGDTKLLRGN